MNTSAEEDDLEQIRPLLAGFEGPQQACSSSRSRASFARQAAVGDLCSFNSDL